jgi:predicted hydrocarbon binding protein
MALFQNKSKKVEEKKVEENYLSFPKVEINYTITESPLGSLILTITTLGDEDDYIFLSEKSAETFYELNKDFLENMENFSCDNYEYFIQILNTFLHINKLGHAKFFINENQKKIFINHYESPFAKIFKNKKNQPVCHFLTKFYEIIFENLLKKQIKIKETECGVNNEKCVFEIVID